MTNIATDICDMQKYCESQNHLKPDTELAMVQVRLQYTSFGCVPMCCTECADFASHLEDEAIKINQQMENKYSQLWFYKKEYQEKSLREHDWQNFEKASDSLRIDEFNFKLMRSKVWQKWSELMGLDGRWTMDKYLKNKQKYLPKEPLPTLEQIKGWMKE